MSEKDSDPRGDHATRSGVLRLMLLDVGLPIGTYYAVRMLGGTPYLSLLAAVCASLVGIGYGALRDRRFDGVAGFMAALFGVGLVVALLTSDPRMLLLKDSAGTATAGLIMLGSRWSGRPFMYHMVMRLFSGSPEKRAEVVGRWHTDDGYRRVMFALSTGWGAGLLAEAVLRVPLVFWLPIDVTAGLSTVLLVMAGTLLALWTKWYVRRATRPAVAHTAGAR